MRYAVWTTCSCPPELVTEEGSVTNAVSESVRCFSDVPSYSFPIYLRLFALRADGKPDRRYRPVVFSIDHDPNVVVVCHAWTWLGSLVRHAGKQLGR